MLEFAKYYGYNVYSQNGEDGIIDQSIQRIGLQGTAIEFGGADGFYCSNVAYLRRRRFWRVKMYDLKPVQFLVEQKEVTPENVNELSDCAVLSIDIDGNDYNVWKAYKGKPAIVIIEINSSIEPEADGPVSDPNHGTAYKPMVELGIKKGYFLLCHTGNLIFVDEKYKQLFEIKGDPIRNHFIYFNSSWL